MDFSQFMLLLALLPDLRIGSPVRSPRFRNAVGLVVQPGPRTAPQYALGVTTNAVQLVANFWGHTALYVRVDGEIVRVVGFDPDRFLMLVDYLGTGRAVSGGRQWTPGIIYDEEKLLRSPDAMVVEFDVTRRAARRLSALLPRPGTAGPTHVTGLPNLYVTRGGVHLPLIGGTYGNCIDFICMLLELVNLHLETRVTGGVWGPVTSSQAAMTALLATRDPQRLRLRGPRTGTQFLDTSPTARVLARERNLILGLGFGLGGFRLAYGVPSLLQHGGRLVFDLSANPTAIWSSLGSLATLDFDLSLLLSWVEENTTLSILDPFHAPLIADFFVFAAVLSEYLLAALPADYRRSQRAVRAVHSLTGRLAFVMAFLGIFVNPYTAVITVLTLLLPLIPSLMFS